MTNKVSVVPENKRMPSSLFENLPIDLDERLTALAAIREAFETAFKASCGNDAALHREASESKSDEP